MKPKLIKSFNKEEENYFKFEIKNKDSSVYEEILVKFLEELGFERPFFPKIGTSGNDFIDKTYKQRIGFYKFLEDKKFKIHVIFSADCLTLVIKCSQENRNILIKLLEKHFNSF